MSDIDDLAKAANARSSRPPRVPSESGPAVVAIVAVAAVAVVVLLAVGSTGPRVTPAAPAVRPTTSAARAPDRHTEAWLRVQRFVKAELKAPSTANFGSESADFQDPRICVVMVGEGRYVATGWVDSHNSYGAVVRSEFECEVQYLGPDTWRCTALTIRSRS